MKREQFGKLADAIKPTQDRRGQAEWIRFAVEDVEQVFDALVQRVEDLEQKVARLQKETDHEREQARMRREYNNG